MSDNRCHWKLNTSLYMDRRKSTSTADYASFLTPSCCICKAFNFRYDIFYETIHDSVTLPPRSVSTFIWLIQNYIACVFLWIFWFIEIAFSMLVIYCSFEEIFLRITRYTSWLIMKYRKNLRYRKFDQPNFRNFRGKKYGSDPGQFNYQFKYQYI